MYINRLKCKRSKKCYASSWILYYYAFSPVLKREFSFRNTVEPNQSKIHIFPFFILRPSILGVTKLKEGVKEGVSVKEI